MPSVLLALTLASAPQAQFAETRRMLPFLDSAGLDLRASATGDADGDGDVDVLLARVEGSDTDEGDHVLLVNHGAGLFRDRSDQLPAELAASWTLQMADLDGDGDLDVFAGHPLDIFNPVGTGEVLANNGAGVFTSAVRDLGPAGTCYSSNAADVDVDGDIDVVAAYGGSPLILLRNTGAGLQLMPDASAFPALPGDVGDLELEDLDNDGAPELLFNWFGGFDVLGNDGAGGFSTQASFAFQTNELDLGDVDGDGDLDVYVAGNLFVPGGNGDGVFLNDGTGTLTQSTSPLPAVALAGNTVSPNLTDLDGDGFPEVIAAGGLVPWEFFALENTTLGTFNDISDAVTPLAPLIDDILVLDADGDDDPDVMTFTNGAEPHLWLNDGERFTEAHSEPNGYRAALSSPLKGAVGDVNGDGTPDLLSNAGLGSLLGGLAPPQNVALIHINAGKAVFTGEPVEFTLQPYVDAESLLLVDVDADGDLDVPLGLAIEDRLYVNDGAGAFTELPNAIPAAGDSTWGLASGDLNGNGQVDLVAARSSGLFFPSYAELLTGDGTGQFSAAPGAITLFGGGLTEVYSDLVTLDADADGDLDLLLGGFSQTEVHLNDGAGLFTWSANFGAGNVDAGDVNNDGSPDFVLSTVFFPDRVYLGSGTGAFNLGFTLDADSAGNDPHLVDYDGDGDLDLFTGQAQVRLYNGTGTGQFLPENGAIDLTGQLLAVDDLNQDGEVDVIVSQQSQIRIATGLRGGHVAWASLPRVGKQQTIEVFGPASAPYVLAAATASAEIALPPFGTLLLDPTKIFIVDPAGTIPASGVAAVEALVPDQPSLVGATLWWQALVGGSLQLSNSDVTTFSAF